MTNGARGIGRPAPRSRTETSIRRNRATSSVRIVGNSEEVAKPSDGGRWGEAVLSLTLVEV
jgi:hypothetical protein